MGMGSLRFQKWLILGIAVLFVSGTAASSNPVKDKKLKTIGELFSKIGLHFGEKVQGRQTVTLDRTGIFFNFSVNDVVNLMKAFVWQMTIFIMAEAWALSVLTMSYKDVFCDYITGDCETRYGIPRFEPESEQLFVSDEKKTLSLNEKNLMAYQHAPFPLAEGYETLDIFPPLKHRPEPPLPFDEPNTPAEAPAPSGTRRIGLDGSGFIRQHQPDKLDEFILSAAEKAFQFLSFSYDLMHKFF